MKLMQHVGRIAFIVVRCFCCRMLKEQAFGPMNFWVTSTVNIPEVEGGVMVRGNMRGPSEQVFADVSEKVEGLFGEYLKTLPAYSCSRK